MYNYNLLNPININYRNPNSAPYKTRKEGEEAQKGAPELHEERNEGNKFPNGSKVQVDYTKNKINIAQIVEDFRNTIAAINAPKELSDEVNLYLGLVEKESKKENPSREIILSNLRNASKISDKFIEESLKKPSTVVEDWVNALFLQKIDLKSDPSFINEAFRIQIPEKKSNGALTGAASAVENMAVQNMPSNSNVSAPLSASEPQNPSQPNFFNPNPLPQGVSAEGSIPQTAYNPPAAPQPAPKANEDALSPVFQNEQSITVTSKGVQKQTFEAISDEPQATEAHSLNIVSNSNEFSNSNSVNLYGASKSVTINEIKPIGQAPLFFEGAVEEASQPQALQNDEIDFGQMQAQLEQAQVYKQNITYSTTAAQGGAEMPAAAAVSFENSSVTPAIAANQAPALIPSEAQTLKEAESAAKSSFVRAKRIIKENGNPYNAIKLYDEALNLAQNTGNDNLCAAIHYERGCVLDDFDHVEFALKDYNKATKCSDENLKTRAHLKMGRIYDEYVMFDPAVQHYTLALEASENAANPGGKTKALRCLAGIFTDRYDKENAETFTELAVDAAYETGSPKTLVNTLREAAQNFEYIGEDTKALQMYKNAAKVLYETQNYDLLSQNYEDASAVMDRLGNGTKAMSLLSKALLYRQKAELQEGQTAKQA